MSGPWLKQHATRLVYAALALTLLAAALLRFVGLGDYWLNPDEGIYYSVISWPELAQRSAEIAENAHPPFYYHLLWLWSRASLDLAWLRAPAALAGTAAVLGAFLLGRELSGGGRGLLAGVLAALLFAVAPAMVTLSKLIRPYTLQVAFLLFSLWGLLRWHRTGGRAPLATFAACMALALLTHYSSLFAFAAAGTPFAVLLLRRRLPRRALVELAAAAAIPLAVALAVWLLHMRGELARELQAHAYSTWLRPHLANDVAQVWRQALGVCGYVLGDPLSGTAIVALLAALALAIARGAAPVWLAPLAAFTLAAIASLLHLYPLGPARHSAYLAPFLVLPVAWALAAGLTARPTGRWGTIAAVGLALFLRQELYLGLSGNRRVTRLGAEQVLRVADLEAMRPALERVKSTPGVVALSADGFMTLGPLWQAERLQAQRVEGLRRFRWGQREVVVHAQWWLSMQGTEIGKDWHLLAFLAKADRVFPDLQLGRQRALQMLFAGSDLSPMQGLLQYDQMRRAPNRLVANAAAVPGLGMLELDVPTLLAEGRAALQNAPRSESGGTVR